MYRLGVLRYWYIHRQSAEKHWTVASRVGYDNKSPTTFVNIKGGYLDVK